MEVERLGAGVSAGEAEAVLEQFVRRDDPLYTQTWSRLPASQ
jgi:hypothetical protein